MAPQCRFVSTRLTLLGAALTLALGSACGGGGGSNATGSPTPQVVTTLPEGIWGGTQSYSNLTKSTTAVAVVLGDGEARLINGTGYQFVTTLDQGLGTGTAYDVVGVPPAPFSITETGLTAKTSFEATVTVAGDATAFNLPQYNVAYDTPLDAATLAGSFLSSAVGNTLTSTLTFTLGADGTFTGSSAAGDTFSGTFTIPDATKSAFKMSFTFTPSGGAAEAMTGLATYVPNSGQTVRSLGLIASGTTRSFVGFFGKQ